MANVERLKFIQTIIDHMAHNSFSVLGRQARPGEHARRDDDHAVAERDRRDQVHAAEHSSGCSDTAVMLGQLRLRVGLLEHLRLDPARVDAALVALRLDSEGPGQTDQHAVDIAMADGVVMEDQPPVLAHPTDQRTLRAPGGAVRVSAVDVSVADPLIEPSSE